MQAPELDDVSVRLNGPSNCDTTTHGNVWQICCNSKFFLVFDSCSSKCFYCLVTVPCLHHTARDRAEACQLALPSQHPFSFSCHSKVRGSCLFLIAPCARCCSAAWTQPLDGPLFWEGVSKVVFLIVNDCLRCTWHYESNFQHTSTSVRTHVLIQENAWG
jgi:hypothetical protein